MKASVFYTNIKSLNEKFNELEQIIYDKNDKPTAICLSETWLPSDCLFNLYTLSGYKMVISEITNKTNLVAIYVDETVAYEVIPTTGNLCCTSLTISCFISKNVILCCIYKSTSNNCYDYLIIFELLLTCLQHHDQKCIMFCDFNKSLLQNSQFVDEYYAIITQNSFSKRLEFTSRVTGTTITLFDHVTYNERVNSIESCINFSKQYCSLGNK